MNKFDFIIEKKITTWECSKVYIEAESEKEALERCKNEDFDYVYNSEIDYDYMNILDPVDNECNSTFIISQSDGTILYENGL